MLLHYIIIIIIIIKKKKEEEEEVLIVVCVFLSCNFRRWTHIGNSSLVHANQRRPYSKEAREQVAAQYVNFSQ